MTLPELQSCLDRLGVKLSVRADRLAVDAPAGTLTPEVKAALAAHKPALLALLTPGDDQTDPARPPAGEPFGPAGSPDWGPPPADRWWRTAVARWPVEWRERWGRRANELQDRGEPWDAAEWIAFNELAEAKCPGEVV